MKRRIETAPQTTGDIKTLLKKGAAVGTAALSLSLGLGACSQKEAPAPPPPDPRPAELAHDSQMVAKEFTCSIVDKDPIIAIAPNRDEKKHLLFQGQIDFTLDLKPVSEEAAALASKYASVDTADYEQDIPVIAIFPHEKPFEKLAEMDTNMMRYNQELLPKPEDPRTINGHLPYLPNENGDITDRTIGIVRDVYTVRKQPNGSLAGVRTRGAAICGTLHFGDKGWEVVKDDKVERGPTFIDTPTPPVLPVLKELELTDLPTTPPKPSEPPKPSAPPPTPPK